MPPWSTSGTARRRLSDASATSLALAAIAAEHDERETSDRKRDLLTVTDGR